MANVESELEEERKLIRDTALHASEQIRNYNKTYRDARHKKPNMYCEGDYVIQDDHNKPGVNTKLKPKYKSPYQIAKSIGSNRYVVKDIPGYNLMQKPLNDLVIRQNQAVDQI